MSKTILFTKNPNFVPTSLEQVSNFADENNKFYVCYTDDNAKAASLEVGAHVLTGKGNHIYVLEVEDGTTTYDFAKNTNITRIVSVDYPFADYQPVKKAKKATSIKGMSDRIKEMFMPTEAEGVRIATDGNICVATAQGYVTIDKDNNLISYPEELTLNLPVFIISKPKEQLAVGDVIALEKSYAKVTKINGGKITAISYTGAGRIIHTIKDFLFNNTMVRVVVSLAGNLGNNMNPMFLLAMSKDKDSKSLLPLLMMSQNNGAMNMNPLALMAFAGDGDFDVKDMLMMSAF